MFVERYYNYVAAANASHWMIVMARESNKDIVFTGVPLSLPSSPLLPFSPLFSPLLPFSFAFHIHVDVVSKSANNGVSWTAPMLVSPSGDHWFGHANLAISPAGSSDSPLFCLLSSFFSHIHCIF